MLVFFIILNINVVKQTHLSLPFLVFATDFTSKENFATFLSKQLLHFWEPSLSKINRIVFFKGFEMLSSLQNVIQFSMFENELDWLLNVFECIFPF